MQISFNLKLIKFEARLPGLGAGRLHLNRVGHANPGPPISNVTTAKYVIIIREGMSQATLKIHSLTARAALHGA